MLSNYERAYVSLIKRILTLGERRQTRNGRTIALFGEHLEFSLTGNQFPLLQGRKMYYKGVLGELAAMLRKPKHISDFEKWGCNYWKQWADEEGNLTVDYGNAWLDYNGIDQLKELIYTLQTNPTDRRLIITGWRPDRLAHLSLPCCHHTYQFYVSNDSTLNMLWMQRSVDTMIGLPSDAIFAAAWLIAISNETSLRPGKIIMSLGDTHIYQEHLEPVQKYLRNVNEAETNEFISPSYEFKPAMPFQDTVDFEPDQLIIHDYLHFDPIKFELKS